MGLQTWLSRLSSLPWNPTPPPRRSPSPRAALALEVLESREVPSAVSWNPANGVLHIQLKSQGRMGDTIVLGNHNGRVWDSSGDHALNVQYYIPAAQVREIRIYGSDKADTIHLGHVHQGNFPDLQRTRIEGRGGNDAIHGSHVNDIIFGQAGNDVINGLGGHDTIYGGNGDDQLMGGDGADMVYGEKGNDWLYGTDHYNKDGHRDQLFGGAGNDWTRVRDHRHDFTRGIENLWGNTK